MPDQMSEIRPDSQWAYDIAQAYKSGRKAGLEEVFAIIDKLAHRYCHQRFIANHGEAYRLAVDAIGKSIRARITQGTD
jgi:hypothetical protein